MSTNGNAKIAFAIVLAAGASTALGAAVVFFPSLVKLASRRVLAASLGFSAGVMSYVSFIEIFGKATSNFTSAGHEENLAYIYSTCCFFGGVLTMMLLNVAVHILLGGPHRHHHHDRVDGCQHPEKGPKKKSSRESVNQEINDDVLTAQPCCSSDPLKQLHTFQRMASVLEHEHHVAPSDDEHEVVIVEHQNVTNTPRLSGNEEKIMERSLRDDDNEKHSSNSDERQSRADKTVAGSDQLEYEIGEANQKLQKMGLKTALAIGLHNFPEGLATFVAALEDPAVGVVLATAIAIHNIPEGLCVALPIYYATGNRLKAFLWALLSGASEVVAALLGWLILASVFSDTTYAILFGLVAGMMVIISIKELLPTAHQYDPQDTVVTFSFIGGMSLMALSLVLFQI